jgi:hypothetical protein
VIETNGFLVDYSSWKLSWSSPIFSMVFGMSSLDLVHSTRVRNICLKSKSLINGYLRYLVFVELGINLCNHGYGNPNRQNQILNICMIIYVLGTFELVPKLLVAWFFFMKCIYILLMYTTHWCGCNIYSQYNVGIISTNINDQSRCYVNKKTHCYLWPSLVWRYQICDCMSHLTSNLSHLCY